MDTVDILIQLIIFASFIVFGFAVWSIKKSIDKQKKQNAGSNKSPKSNQN